MTHQPDDLDRRAAHEGGSTWRVDFGDEYLSLHADDVELMT